MKARTSKGMWKRTFRLLFSIRIPWHLYVFQVILGIVSTKVALLAVPYQTNMQMGNLNTPGLIACYLGFSLLSVIASLAERVPGFYSNAVVTRDLRVKLIHHALRLPMRDYETSASNIVSWITVDTQYADGLLTSIVGFITGAAAAYMSMTSMAAIDTQMLWIVPFVLIYILFSTWLEGRLLFLRQRRARGAMAELTAYLSEHLGMFTQIRQLHTAAAERKNGLAAIQHYYRADLYQSVLTLCNGLVSGSLTSIVTILIFVLGVPMVRRGLLSLTELAQFQTYMLTAYQSLSTLPALYSNLMLYNGQLFYIGGLMAQPEEEYDRRRSMDLPDADITFDHVSFAYGEEPVLEDVSFTIPKGSVTAILGPNGSGKTTLLKLLERFYTPQDGAIYFGDKPVEDLQLQEWRQSLAYVLQNPQLFNGSIRDNITYGMNRPVSDAEVENAAKLASADEFIRALPGGYDFVIGDNGSRLSAGQRQRIAIARAVILDPAYLLMDEGTCNMDILSEQQVTKGLTRLMQGRTTVLISHDMNVLSRVDHVIVLSHGRVEADGSLEEALAASPTLRAMIQAEERSAV